MHSASFITCFSVGALHSSEIHRVQSSALSLLARVGPHGDLAAYVAARVCVYLRTRRQSFRKSKVIAPASVAIKHLQNIGARERTPVYCLDRPRIASGRTLRPYFRRCRAPLPYPSTVSPPCFSCVFVILLNLSRVSLVPRDPFNGHISRRLFRTCRNNV